MQNNITVLMPGGFKPPHDGHLSLANKFASRSDVDKVLVMVGPTEREGINRKQSLAIWNALPKNPKVKVIPVSEDNPMTAAFKYVFNLPKDSTETIALGSSSKDPDDAKRAKIFRLAIEKYKNTPSKNGETAPPNIVVTDLTDDVYSVYKNRTDDLNGSSISATTLRNDLKNNDFNNFKTNYPNIDERTVKKIFHILKGTTMNELKKQRYMVIIKEMLKEEDDSFMNAILGSEKDYKTTLDKINKRASELTKAAHDAKSKAVPK